MTSNVALVIGIIVAAVLVKFVAYDLARRFIDGRRKKIEEEKPVAVEVVAPPEPVSKHEQAIEALRDALKAAGFCVWELPETSEAYKIGIRFGVNLDWPELQGEALNAQFNEILDLCIATGRSLNFMPVIDPPNVYAGGAMSMLCGFRDKPFIEATPAPKELGLSNEE